MTWHLQAGRRRAEALYLLSLFEGQGCRVGGFEDLRQLEGSSELGIHGTLSCAPYKNGATMQLVWGLGPFRAAPSIPRGPQTRARHNTAGARFDHSP